MMLLNAVGSGNRFQEPQRAVRHQHCLCKLLLNLLASLADFKLDLIRERVKKSMDRANRQGKKLNLNLNLRSDKIMYDGRYISPHDL